MARIIDEDVNKLKRESLDWQIRYEDSCQEIGILEARHNTLQELVEMRGDRIDELETSHDEHAIEYLKKNKELHDENVRLKRVLSNISKNSSCKMASLLAKKALLSK